ncbi:monocarboxylate transporter 3 isoform X2 [Nematostella vectensis]|uniref:monocarboxylate transporter 3 isoform X2 n=1 Tax=Nematostella vectensis TaxID=45351 RepID=UPI002076D718|nr:monocarboxylate transporter 3 isoform X2 [Nematostella vectensis]
MLVFVRMPLICSQSKTHSFEGPWGWLIVAASLIINIFLLGFMLSFGVLLPVLSSEFNESKGKTAWVGSLATGLLFSMGLPVVQLTALLTCRAISITGCVICAVSLVSSSFAKNMTVMFVSYGLLAGIGGGLIIAAIPLIIKKYFKTKLPLAIGLVASGASVGVMAMGPTLQALIDAFGWRNSLRIMSGVVLCLAVLCLTFDPNVEQESTQAEQLNVEEVHVQVRNEKEDFDCSVFANPTYMVGVVGSFLIFFGMYVPMFHLVRFGQDLGFPSSKTSLLFIYIGICSTVFRVISGQVISRQWMRPLQAVQLAAFIMGSAMLALPRVSKYGHLVVFAVVYGIANGSFAASYTVFLLTAVKPRQAAMGIGFGFLAPSVAIFAGPPTVGFIADQLGSYIPAFYMVGGVIMLPSCLPFVLLCCDRGGRKQASQTQESRLELIGTRLANPKNSSLFINVL